MSFALIAAVGQGRELGKKGGLLWPLSGDLKRFKSVTMGHPMLMGLATWRSLPGKLPGRRHFVVAHDAAKVEGDVEAVTDLAQFVAEWRTREEQVFVVGGGSIYRQMLPYVDEMYLTEVAASDAEADTFFPEFEQSEWTREVVGEGADHGINYQHVLYKRK